MSNIFLIQNDQDETIEVIKNVLSGEFPDIDYEVSLIVGWFRLKVHQSIFSDFHHLIAFFTDISGERVIAFCKHKTVKSKDYIVKLDIDAGNVHMIGSFRTNQNFGIYLPKSGNDPKGNISISPVKEIDFHHEMKQLLVQVEDEHF